ncbi:MAG: ornithine--oxo-acid transaminase [Bdellovibrionales bacterium]|nr:ornithine--oxo-acid transaminase [Bdellovibrionales bacterium]
MTGKELQELEQRYGAQNYQPLDIVLVRGEGCWVYDIEGKRYLDCLSAYSALNQGHVHPKLLAALVEQAQQLSLTSRAFRNQQLPLFYEQICKLSGFEKALAMNSGAEAVETAIKLVRKWGYRVKGIAEDQAEILVCSNNFHGRTVAIVGFSTEPSYRHGFGPFAPGFRSVPYADADALIAAITPNTAAVLLEPIQGEGGIIVPPDGYLRAVAEACRATNTLLVLDEIQTGLGRTGRMFAYDHEGIRPDVLILGKALSGGMYPVSVVLADAAVMDMFRPGEHGSTFGGNPLGCAVSRAALDVLVEERLAERTAELGGAFIERLKTLESSLVKDVRGKGLLIGIELKVPARPYCERLAERGILCKETHSTVIRFAPPLVITEEQLDFAWQHLSEVLCASEK